MILFSAGIVLNVRKEKVVCLARVGMPDAFRVSRIFR